MPTVENFKSYQYFKNLINTLDASFGLDDVLLTESEISKVVHGLWFEHTNNGEEESINLVAFMNSSQLTNK